MNRKNLIIIALLLITSLILGACGTLETAYIIDASETEIPTITPRPSPSHLIQGSVAIAGGNCCVGGVAGSTIDIEVNFSAVSSAGEIQEMRVKIGPCSAETRQIINPWEPYTTTRYYQYQVPLNWSTFYAAVQYKDSLGNISFVYCDDIAVEGMPPTLTPNKPD